MTKAIHIPVDGTPELVNVNGYAELSALVGGYIEGIYGPRSNPWVGYCHEEGKLIGLPINDLGNAFASMIGWHGAGTDLLVGPIVIFGPTDDEGNETDVPEELIEQMWALVEDGW